MRIIVNGQQAFGRAVLDALVARGENIVGIYTAPDGPRGPDPLKTGALEHGLPVFQPKSFRRESVWRQMRELAPDLAVMAYVTLFVPRQALDIPTRGTIQYHPSLLPLHKGPSAINWPIIFNEKRTGLTIFWPDEGLDTGPVLLRKEVAIGPDDTLGSLYFEQLFPMGVAAMLEAVDQVRDGKAAKIPQQSLLDAETKAAMRRVQVHAISDPAETLGTYESWCRAEQAEVDWRKPAQEVYNLIRGCNPQPGAWTRHAGKTLQLFDCKLASDASAHGDAGEVVSLSKDGFVVRAGAGGGVAIARVRPAGGAKMAASEFAATVGLKAGDRFG